MKLKEIVQRDKKWLLTLIIFCILAPLALNYVYGIYIENLPFGVVNLDDSSLSRSIVSGFESHPGLKVSFYGTSENELEEAIKAKKITAGMIIPDDFYQDLLKKKEPRILLLIDGTNLLTGRNALGYSSAILETFNAQFRLNYLEGENMLPQAARQKLANFTFTERILYDPLLSYPSYVIYIVELYLIQMFYVFFYLLPLLVEEKKALFEQRSAWKDIKQRCKNLLARLGVMGITINISSFIGLGLCNVFFSLPLRGSILIYFIFMAVFLLALTAVSLAISYFINERGAVYCAEIYLITGLVVILTSGAVWPEYMMPGGMPQMVKIIWPYIHAALPFRFFNLKGLGWDLMLPYIWHCILYAFCWLAIGISLYSFKIYRRQKCYDL